MRRHRATHVGPDTINLGGLAMGLVIYPRATWRAFMRGRRSGNLYRNSSPAWQSVLDDDIDALRARLPVMHV